MQQAARLSHLGAILQCWLHAQIGRAYFFAREQVGGSVTHDYAAIFHNVAVVGDAQCLVGVLFHQKNRGPVGVDLLDEEKIC